MHTLYLITSNPGKVQSFSTILKQIKSPFTIEMLNAEYIENKEENSTRRVVLDGAKICAERYQKPVLVQDTWLFVDSLKWFPWVNTKFCIKTVWLEGILKLLEWNSNRAATRQFSLGCCMPWWDPVAFEWEVRWTISQTLRWNQGFGFDPIFIPDWYHQTFSENIELRDTLSPFNNTVL